MIVPTLRVNAIKLSTNGVQGLPCEVPNPLLIPARQALHSRNWLIATLNLMAVTLRVGMPAQALPRRATSRRSRSSTGFPRRSVATMTKSLGYTNSPRTIAPRPLHRLPQRSGCTDSPCGVAANRRISRPQALGCPNSPMVNALRIYKFTPFLFDRLSRSEAQFGDGATNFPHSASPFDFAQDRLHAGYLSAIPTFSQKKPDGSHRPAFFVAFSCRVQ